jgi:hypothetical protein
MVMQQNQCLEFVLADGKIKLTVDTATPLGVMHDALMELKGWTVDRMVLAQREEAEAAKRAMESDKIEPITQHVPDHFE